MVVTIVHVLVKDDHIDGFIQATRLNHLESIKEEGNCRFDVLQSDESPNQFVLYEAYKCEDDAREHKKSNHYLNWRESVADWMEVPRSGITYSALFPE